MKELKQIEPTVDEPPDFSAGEERLMRGVYYLKAKLTIKRLDTLLMERNYS
jgi:hypothetical protein